MEVFMRDSDAFSWYMERDPVLRATVVAVMWLDHSPDWTLLARKVDQATRLVPLFRSRVIELPGPLAAPRWASDPEFDLTWHLRRIEAPTPHSEQTVVEFARREAMTAFDRARPLWHFTLIEGLEGGRAALVMKLHHSLTDGLGGMELVLLLFDTVPGSPAPTSLNDEPPPESLGSTDLIRQSIAGSLERVIGFVVGRARSVVPSTLHASRHPLESVRATVAGSRSVYRTVAPVFDTLSTLMTGRGLRRRLDLVELRLEDLVRAAASQGGTVNDGFLASAAAGLRLYHERHGARAEKLRVTVPMTIRKPGDPIGGNRITLMRLVVPVSDPGPACLIPEMHRACRRARDEPSLAHTDAIAGVLNLFPAEVLASILKRVDFLASDVPGPPFPLYLGDAGVEKYVAFGPTIGSSVNLTLLSYNGRCFVGVTSDSAAIPDHEVFVECLRRGFEEVLALGGDHEPARLPLHDEAPLAV
jgi:diacylglycerol O-acyltransferase / wax synthase